MSYWELVEELGTEPGRLIGDNMYTRCPIHGGTKEQFSFNVESGLWICFRCGDRGSLTKLVMLLGDSTRIEALSRVQQYERGMAHEVTHDEVMDAFAPQSELLESVTSLKRTLHERVTRERWPNWWPERGFSTGDWADWDCSLDLSNGDTILPVYDRDSFRGEIMRRQDGVKPKYLYSKGMAKSTLLYGLHRLSEPLDQLVLVEGPLDAIWLQHYGIEGVALLGSSLSRKQLQLIIEARPHQVVLALDRDEAGREGTMGMMPALINAFERVRCVVIPDAYNDVQDIRDGNELKHVVAEAVTAERYALALE